MATSPQRILDHKPLNATLNGLILETCVHYRGLQYATISERFALPVLKDNWNGEDVDCTKWGPRCPQVKVDMGFLLRTPEKESVFYDETEDEFKCANLDVMVPETAGEEGEESGLPVLVWVHGGSQTVSYGNGASKIGDTLTLVKESVNHGMPMIVVSIQYRLNMFHVGDGLGNKNLGFKDQEVALQWVRKHIGGFGGDADNITLAGESAGAVFVQGLIVSGVKVKRGVLMSGSFYMSPPRAEADVRTLLIEPVLKKVKEQGYESLKEAPVDVFLRAQAGIPGPSVFMQQDDCFADWHTKTGQIEELLIGECEFESILWRNGVESLTAEQIVECFDKAGASSQELKELYHTNGARPAQCKHGALDFINDLVWVMPSLTISKLFKDSGKKVYRYLFDQANPWQASSRAHHAVDLLYLFGGFDMSMNSSAEALGREMRKRFITFVNGEAPWLVDKVFAFGPLGGHNEIDDAGVAARRRVKQVEVLQKMDGSSLKMTFGSLAAGRISLHN